MNIGVSLAGVRGVPGGDVIAQAFVELQAAIVTGWNQEHNPDGTHAIAKWVNPAFTASAFRPDGGVGNTWAVNSPGSANAFTPISYFIVNKTMFLNLSILNSTLTITTASNAVFVAIPDGYRVASAQADHLMRACYGHCSIIDSGAGASGTIQAAPGQTQLQVSRVTGTFVTAADFTIVGQVFFEIA